MEDIRWIQRFDNYSRAYKQLKKALDISNERELSDLEKQGVIQAFEYTYELAWKTIKDFFYFKGNETVYGPKDSFKLAFKEGLIEDGEIWMDMVESRNKSSHTYNEEIADAIYKAIIIDYVHSFQALKMKLEALKQQELH